jgi:hypothetical protein
MRRHKTSINLQDLDIDLYAVGDLGCLLLTFDNLNRRQFNCTPGSRFVSRGRAHVVGQDLGLESSRCGKKAEKFASNCVIL